MMKTFKGIVVFLIFTSSSVLHADLEIKKAKLSLLIEQHDTEKSNKIEEIKKLLSTNKVLLDAFLNSDGQTALTKSALHNNHDLVTLFLQEGSNPNKFEQTGDFTPLHLAVYNSSKGIKKNNKKLEHNSKHTLHLLVNSKANIHLKNKKKTSPLDYALKLNKDLASFLEDLSKDFIKDQKKQKEWEVYFAKKQEYEKLEKLAQSLYSIS